jgi:DNA modification methylase
MFVGSLQETTPTVCADALIHGDCLSVLPHIPTGTIDMVLADLPHGITRNRWDAVIPFAPLWRELARVIKPRGAIVLTANQPFTSQLVMSNPKLFKYSLVWEKNKFSDFMNAKRRPLRIHEDILVFYKKAPVYNPQYGQGAPYVRWNTQEAVSRGKNYNKMKQNVSRSDGRRYPTSVLHFPRIERPKHPTQKPVELCEYLIQTFSQPGEVVLDCCMGVGTTPVACKRTGRAFIGIELQEEYFLGAVDRVLTL